MKTVRLDQVCRIEMGQAPPGESYNVDGRGLPMIAGPGDFGDGVPEAKKFTTAAQRRCQAGDIILGVRASIGDRVVADTEYCLGRGVAGLRAEPAVDVRYLWHWLGHSAPELSALGRGATFKQVTRDDIRGLRIPVPPIEEQRRIAAILDKADDLRATRRAALAHLDSLTQSIFLDMFGDQTAYTDSVPLESLADVQGGLQVSASRQTLPYEVPYLRVANVQRGQLDLAEVKHLRATQTEISRTQLEAGDVLIVEGHGNPEEIGRAATWDGSLVHCVHQNHLIRARARNGLMPRYITDYLNSAHGRRHLLRSANTTSGLNTISVSVVKSAPIAVPPIEQQVVYVNACHRVDEQRSAMRRMLAQTDALLASLQHRAFSGAL